MRTRRRGYRALTGASLLVLVVAVGLTASNVVAASKRSNTSTASTIDQLKPTECNPITTMTAIVTGAGTFSGTGASELILGSAGVDTIRGNGGNDCIVGGGGNDSLRGGGGAGDICIGGPGTDTFTGCETQYP